MNLSDKVKNLFTEEVEEEVVVKPTRESKTNRENKSLKRETPVKEIEKEVRKVEIAPARRENKILVEEEKTDINVSDGTAISKEEKFVFPVYFSDEDFKDLEKPKQEPKKEEPIKNLREVYQGKKEEIKPQKSFKPSPIISPVYGVLDENYKKEDITVKEPINTGYYKSDKITVDDIRNKAYGTLEDEVENGLFNDPIVLKEEKLEKIKDDEIDIFEDLEKSESSSKSRVDLLREDYDVSKEVAESDLTKELEIQKKKIEEINEIIKNNISERSNKKDVDNILTELDEIEDELSNVKEKEEKKEVHDDEEKEDSYNDEENENTKEEDDLVESDLFNLIDSMYEKRDEE